MKTKTYLLVAAVFVLLLNGCEKSPSIIITAKLPASADFSKLTSLFSDSVVGGDSSGKFHLIHGRMNDEQVDLPAFEGATVFSAREVTLLDYAQASKAAGLVRTRHAVKDVERWMTQFKRHHEHRHDDRGYQAWGHAIAIDRDEPKVVYVTHFVSDLAKAREFMSSPGLRIGMAKGGVVGEPEIWFYDLVESLK